MIDDPATVARLIEQMQAYLPIPASPTSQLVRTLRQQGSKISADQRPQHFLYFRPLPHGHGSFRPTFLPEFRRVRDCGSSSRFVASSLGAGTGSRVTETL